MWMLLSYLIHCTPEVQEPQPSAEPQEDTSSPEEPPTCSESVAAVIEENIQFAVDCFDKKIKGGYSVNRLTGKVSLKVNLEEGKVTDASVFNNELESSTFPKCLIKRVKNLNSPQNVMKK